MTEEDKRNDGREIVITPTAKSKAFRLLNEGQLRHQVRNRAGRIYYRSHDEYHLVFSDIAIVVAVEEDALVIRTQMHAHPDYRTDDTYVRVDEFGETPDS